MFKNWFKSTNAKRMEDQLAQLREDVNVLQAKMNELINKHVVEEKEPSTLDNVLEKEELVAVVIDPASILENPTTHGLESLIMKEPFDLLDNIIEKVLDQVENIAEQVSDKVENIAEQVSDKVENIAEQVSDKVENIAEQVSDKVDKVLDEVPILAEKVLEQVATVEKEKETNIVPPKKRRQSKKAAQLEEALPKLIV
jgi:hypothetical protein